MGAVCSQAAEQELENQPTNMQSAPTSNRFARLISPRGTVSPLSESVGLDYTAEPVPLEAPLFTGYVSSPKVTADDMARLKSNWNAMLEGNSEFLREAKKKDIHTSPITIFYDAFYNHLFKDAPQTKVFFQHGGISVRAQSLIRMINVSLNALDSEEGEVAARVCPIAKSHGGKGIDAKQYAPVINALLTALKTCLGDEFSPSDAESWCKAYSLLFNLMTPLADRAWKEKQEKAKAEGSEALPLYLIKQREAQNNQNNQTKEKQLDNANSLPNMNSTNNIQA